MKSHLPPSKQIIYAILSLIFLTLSFLTGRLSVQIEKDQKAKPIEVIEDLDAPGTLEDMLELIKKDHNEPCPVCECELTSCVPSGSTDDTSSAVIEGQFVASKQSSSKKFHKADSAVAKRIKDENKVYFQSKEEAMAAGYVPGSSVK